MTFWDYLIISPLSTAAHAWPSAGNIVVPETAPALCYEAHRPIGVGGWGGTDLFPYSGSQGGQGWDGTAYRIRLAE